MKCPNCALYHPAQYDQCVSCGTRFTAQDEEAVNNPNNPQQSRFADAADVSGKLRSGWKQMSKGTGIMIAASILALSTGITYFFMTKPPESDRLYQDGKAQLANGQYAFALKSLEQAAAIRPNDPKIMLALARAYVGADQVEKAWNCIMQAQQLGLGVVADPQLASDLANYYKQRNQYDRAAELLRPLANSNMTNKKAELADLDATWGDEVLRQGNTEQALKCWEEVYSLGEGSRFVEAQGRLSTIYQKYATEIAAKGDNEAALKYLLKLNTLSPTPGAYEKISEIYEHQGKLDLAIDQLKNAAKLSSGSAMYDARLASLLMRQGKDLMDKGDVDAGYGCMQQAKSLDPTSHVPTTVVRNIKVDLDKAANAANFSGEVFNAGTNSVNLLNIRLDLVSLNGANVVWSNQVRLIDDFVPSLAPRAAKPFDFNVPMKAGLPCQMRLMIDGSLYKTYNLNEKGEVVAKEVLSPTKPSFATATPAATEEAKPAKTTVIHAAKEAPASSENSDASATPKMPQPAPAFGTPDGSPEEKTLKDLE